MVKREHTKWRPKRKCPVHNVRLEPSETRFGTRWACPCAECTVACWSGGTSTPADEPTREMRHQAHLAFDPLFRGKGREVRAQVYMSLAVYMGLSQEETHIGYFGIEQCARVIEFCENYRKENVDGKEAHEASYVNCT